MRHRNLMRAGLAVLLLATAAWAGGEELDVGVVTTGDDGIHIPPGRDVGTNRSLNDGAGFRWDINCNGQVNDGNNDAYDGGMQLRVNGQPFQYSSSGRGSPDGREVEFGPWNVSSGGLRVSRRIYVDPKLGYCRWIDIFENSSAQPQTVAVQYFSNLGDSVQVTRTTTGGASPDEKDWGIITGGGEDTSRPALTHIYATKTAKVKPTFRFSSGDDNIYYEVSLTIPASKAAALCFFEAQRGSVGESVKFLDDFNPARELDTVPPALRRIIANMGGTMLTVQSIELPRRDEHDLAVLRNGDELLGSIRNDRFILQTFLGKLELPAGRVVGLSVPSASEPQTQLVLTDGQVLSGTLVNAPLLFATTNGSEMSLPLSKIQTAAFRLSPDKPAEIAVGKQAVVLRNGERLFFRRDDVDLTYHTEYGTVKLSPDHVRSILLDTPEGGLHRVNFTNGSVLSGLLTAETFRLQFDLGPTMDVSRDMVAEFLLSTAEAGAKDLAEMTLRNEDRLLGRIADEALTLKTRYGEFVAKRDDIAKVEFQPEAFGRVQIGLHNGTTVTGQFVGQAIRFQVSPGPELPVFVGHIVSLTCPPPKAPAKTTQPAEPAAKDKQPPAKPADPPFPPAKAPPDIEEVPPPPVLPEPEPPAPAGVPPAAARVALDARKREEAAQEAAKMEAVLAADREAHRKELQAVLEVMEKQAVRLHELKAKDPQAQAEIDKKLAEIASKAAEVRKQLDAIK